jgi:adenosylhomocysteinase
VCSENEINSDVYLLNMGAEDEYGDKFSSERVFANKAPINFLLDAPTLIHYIDPIFFAHNKVCLNLLNSDQIGYSPLPSELDIPLINKWSKIHGVICNDVFAL